MAEKKAKRQNPILGKNVEGARDDHAREDVDTADR